MQKCRFSIYQCWFLTLFSVHFSVLYIERVYVGEMNLILMLCVSQFSFFHHFSLSFTLGLQLQEDATCIQLWYSSLGVHGTSGG